MKIQFLLKQHHYSQSAPTLYNYKNKIAYLLEISKSYANNN